MGDIGSLLRRAMIYETAESAAYSQDGIQKDIEAMAESIGTVKDRFGGDQQLLTRADASVTAWLAEIDKINALMDENRYEEAREEFSGAYQTMEQELNQNVLAISNSSEESPFP